MPVQDHTIQAVSFGSAFLGKYMVLVLAVPGDVRGFCVFGVAMGYIPVLRFPG